LRILVKLVPHGFVPVKCDSLIVVVEILWIDHDVIICYIL
jgi:hypothetical protein